MKLYYFSEMPHHEFPDSAGDAYPSLRLAFPNTHFDPVKASGNYRRYLDEYEHADQVGFDGLMVNEHHSTPSCVNVSANMSTVPRPCRRPSTTSPECGSRVHCARSPTGNTSMWPFNTR